MRQSWFCSSSLSALFELIGACEHARQLADRPFSRARLTSPMASAGELHELPLNALCHRGRQLSASCVDPQCVFDRIYSKQLWGGDGEGLRSGRGSRPENARMAATILLDVMFRYNATRLVDAPSGALAWQRELMPRVHAQNTCFRYHAVDVVSSVVRSNRRLLSQEAWASWSSVSLADLSKQAPPNGYDLILCRP